MDGDGGEVEEWCVKVRGVGSVGASGVTREELGLELTQLGTFIGQDLMSDFEGLRVRH